MLDLEAELRDYATRLDERYPDVTLDELTTSPPDVSVRPQTSRERPGRALILIAAAVVLMLVGALVLVARDDARDPQVPAAPPGDLSGGRGLIAFAGIGESGHVDIYVVAPDGTGLRALTSPNEAEVAPAWSPDGTRLAFLRNVRLGGGELVVIDHATGDETFSANVPNPPRTDLYAPEWSPDGRLIVLNLDNCFCFMMLDLETGTWTTITGASQQGWSPDGKWFVFASWSKERQRPGGLFMVPSDLLGTTDLDDVPNLPGVRLLTESGAPLSWMPDSSAVAIETLEGSIDVVTIADGRLRTLIEDGRAPSFSPDGSHLAYMRVSEDVGRYSVWVAAADGTGAREVATSSVAPTWSPGGTLLTLADADGVFTVRPDGTGMTQLAQVKMTGGLRGAFSRPVWQPGATEAANTDATETTTTEASATKEAPGSAAIRSNESDEPAPATAANDLEPASRHGALPHTGPTTSEHWHMSYQFDICGVSRQLIGNLEDVGTDGRPLYPQFVATGVHSHDDGVIHAHPFTDSSSGVNLTLSTFLDNYDVQLTDTTLSFAEAQGGGTYDEATAQCDGKPAQLVIVVWPDPHRPDDKIIVTDQLGGLPLSVDGMAITIALTADPQAVPLPPIVDNPQID